jgi:excisionase family DNA binding protein
MTRKSVALRKKSKLTSTIIFAPRNLTVPDAARYLGIGPWAMRHLHWEGVLRGFFIGRRLLFDKAVLDGYVDGLVKESAVTR